MGALWHLPGGAIPAGAMIVRELMAEGADTAVWTECYGRGRVVLMSPDLVCVDMTGHVGRILRQIHSANGNRWAGLPDAVGLFPNGRVVMRDAKVVGKDKISATQHQFARAARQVLGPRVEFAAVEWGRAAKSTEA